MLGFLKTTTIFLLNIGDTFKVLENWGIVWAILALVIIWFVGGKLLSLARVKNLMQKAYEKGAAAGSDLAFSHAQKESYAEGS